MAIAHEKDAEHVRPVAPRAVGRGSSSCTRLRASAAPAQRASVPRACAHLLLLLSVGIEEVDPVRGPSARASRRVSTRACVPVRRPQAVARVPPARRRAERSGVERRHAARAGGGDRLAVDVILTSPAANTPGTFVSVEPRLRDRGSRPRRGRAGRGRAPCSGRGRSRRRGRRPAMLARLAGVRRCAAGRRARPSSSPSTSSTTRVRDELDLLVRARAVDHDLRGAELVAPVDDASPSCAKLRQEDRLLHRRVAAADDDDLACRGRTRRRRWRSTRRRGPAARCSDSSPSWRALAPVATITVSRAVLVVADPDAERALGEVDPGDVVGDELGAEALGLAAELLPSSPGP